LFLVLGLSFTQSLGAQGVTGTLFGVVRDESRAILPGTTVTVSSPAMPGGPATVVSNDRGEYRLVELMPGVYKMTVSLAGFSTYEEADLRVTAGGTTERNLTLPLATVAETITVSGQAPVVDTRRTGIAATKTLEEIESVPLERRSNTDYASRLPGATASSYNATNGVTIMGSGTQEVTMTQDGAQYNNVKSGGGYPIADVDAVEEVSVTLLGASAEYQQAQGGVMNIINKSGTNAFRGDGRYYHLLKDVASTPFTLPCNCPEGQTGFKWYGNPDYSGHFGGPILKDRLWYFVGGTTVGWSYREPGQAAPPSDLLDQGLWMRYDTRLSGKVTWKITDKILFTQSNLYEWWEYLNPFPNNTTPLEAVNWYPGDIRVGGSTVTATLNSTTVLTARYSAFVMPDSFIGMGPQLTQKDITTAARRDTFTSLDSGNRFNGAEAGWPRRDEFAAKLNQYIAGNRFTHNLRYGFQIRKNHTHQQTVFPTGVRYFDFNGQPDEAEFREPSSFGAQENATSIWAEDEMNIGGRLTLQVGLRYDNMKAVSPEVPAIDGSTLVERGTPIVQFYGFEQTGATIEGRGTLFSWNTVSPRFGVNLKLTEDGKTVLRGTAGRFYQRVILNDFLDLHPGITNTTRRRWNPATANYSTFISTVDPNANLDIDSDINPESTDSFSVGFDREIARNMGFSVSYAHKRWDNLLGWIDTGGVYGTQTVNTPKGPLTVFPLLNSTSARKFVRTNGPGFSARYHGFMTSVGKRFANRWLANVNYTYADLVRFNPGGQDPNDLINAGGEPRTDGRPHVFNVQGMVRIPKIEVDLGTNLSMVSGQPYGSQVQVTLPQGRRSIFMEEMGTYRTPFQRYVMLRASKSIKFQANRLELIAEMRNLLDEESDGSVASQIFGAANFGQPNVWAWPRRMYLGVRYFFR
jgi:hypothetical protein